MPATTQPTSKFTRASLARIIASMTLGLGMGTFAFPHAYAFGQVCDACAALKAEPACGCEVSDGCDGIGGKCKPRCVPKLSVGQKILGKLDLLGDRIEAEARSLTKSKVSKAHCDCSSHAPACGCESPMGPTCGCEAAGPTCGCEVHSPLAVYMNTHTPSAQAPMVRAQAAPAPTRTAPVAPRIVPNESSRQTLSSIRDGGQVHSSAPFQAKPINPAPAIQPAPIESNLTAPLITSDPPSVPKVPFEKRTPVTTPHQRIPADEAIPSAPSMPNTLKPTTNADEPSLPDVLVDPFRDDASVRRTRDQMEGVLLTSGRKSNQTLQLAPPRIRVSVPSENEANAPIRLTPKQRSVPVRSAEADDSYGIEAPVTDSAVVPSSYLEVIPVKVAPKNKVRSTSTVDEAPSVPRTRVPLR